MEGEYHAIPENAQLVFEAPEVPIANSPLNTNDDQLTRTARDRAWRHIGTRTLYVIKLSSIFKVWANDPLQADKEIWQ